MGCKGGKGGKGGKGCKGRSGLNGVSGRSGGIIDFGLPFEQNAMALPVTSIIHSLSIRQPSHWGRLDSYEKILFLSLNAITLRSVEKKKFFVSSYQQNKLQF